MNGDEETAHPDLIKRTQVVLPGSWNDEEWNIAGNRAVQKFGRTMLYCMPVETT